MRMAGRGWGRSLGSQAGGAVGWDVWVCSPTDTGCIQAVSPPPHCQVQCLSFSRGCSTEAGQRPGNTLRTAEANSHGPGPFP